MSAPYVDVDDFPASCTLPEDGEAKPIGSLLPGLQGALNRTRYLFNRFFPTITGTLTFAAGTIAGPWFQSGQRTLTGNGYDRLRRIVLADADFGGGYAVIAPVAGDTFRVLALSADAIGMLRGDTSAGEGAIVEICTRAMTGGHSLSLYKGPVGFEVLALTMTATTKAYSRWQYDGANWDLLEAVDQ